MAGIFDCAGHDIGINDLNNLVSKNINKIIEGIMPFCPCDERDVDIQDCLSYGCAVNSKGCKYLNSTKTGCLLSQNLKINQTEKNV